MLEISWIVLRFATSFFLGAVAAFLVVVTLLILTMRNWTPPVRPIGDQRGRAG